MEASYFPNIPSLNPSFGGLMFPYDRSLFTLNSLPPSFAGGGCYASRGDYHEPYGLCRPGHTRAPRGSVSPSPLGAFQHRMPSDKSSCSKPRSPVERFYQTDDQSQQTVDKTGTQHTIAEMVRWLRFGWLVLKQRPQRMVRRTVFY